MSLLDAPWKMQTSILVLLLLLFLIFPLHSNAIRHTNINQLTRTFSCGEREHRLREWAHYLYHLEKHLDEREYYLRNYACPQPPRKAPPRLCEYCVPGSRCADGLTCLHRKCQKVNHPNPITCPDEESCGPGQQRTCSNIRPFHFEKRGVLKERLVNLGFFVGKTNFIPNCVMGKVRINCKNREKICKNKNQFCITMTLKECRRDGLLKEDMNGRDNDMCCVKAVPVDCIASKLCRCIAKTLF